MSKDKLQKPDANRIELSEVIRILENHPASFIILGILIFLIVSGGVKFYISGNALNIAGPSDKILQSILLFFGITLTFLGIYIILIRWNLKKNYIISGAMILFYCTSSFFAFYSTIFKHSDVSSPEEGYGYYFKEACFKATLKGKKFSDYKWKQAIAVIRRADDTIDKHFDDNIDLSCIYNIPQNNEELLNMIVKADKIAKKINLGDRIQCFIYSIPATLKIDQINTLNDINKMGGKFVWGASNKVMIVGDDPEDLAQCYLSFSERDKTVFKEAAGLE